MKKIIFFTASLCLAITAGAQLKTLSGHTVTAKQLDSFILQQMDSLKLPGLSFALINNGKIVFHRAIGVTDLDKKQKVRPQSIFEAASLSKPVFALFVLKMVDEGLLSLDTPLYRYLPYPDIDRDERYKLITARMVLDHTTGFPNWRWFEQADTSLHIPRGQLYLKFTPGTQFAYSGEGFHYLSKVVAHLNHLTIQQLDQLFQQKIAAPLHMKYAWFSCNDFLRNNKVTGHSNGKVDFRKWPTAFPEQDSSWFGAAGGLHTEAISYATFLIHLINMKDTQMFQPQVQVPKNDVGEACGLSIVIKSMPYGTLYEHGGNNGNFQSGFSINRANRTGYVFFTNCDKGNVFNKNLRAFLSTGHGNPAAGKKK